MTGRSTEIPQTSVQDTASTTSSFLRNEEDELDDRNDQVVVIPRCSEKEDFPDDEIAEDKMKKTQPQDQQEQGQQTENNDNVSIDESRTASLLRRMDELDRLVARTMSHAAKPPSSSIPSLVDSASSSSSTKSSTIKEIVLKEVMSRNNMDNAIPFPSVVALQNHESICSELHSTGEEQVVLSFDEDELFLTRRYTDIRGNDPAHQFYTVDQSVNSAPSPLVGCCGAW
eukprot:CAMPEP_0118724906 /NCGR_PEP_ID=MMETSP0800-20121206/32849_1 /TAXON_ID=210618 ORGANISM="Striatella unipunctata, Strain CCMP2910" /NCGR_SAMPLE_ID=MMETSP0800 /ASSEMBLY_ACC=CAM_ASM_000638 /LENGTH=227 /DNA_ID=CAMNT_0006633555 /DNA_START=74 /DNA_END=757 /DNA_ORIENTATION=+